MSRQTPIENRSILSKMAWRMSARVLLSCAAVITITVADAQGVDRSGEQVVAAACGTCHATGANGAPKIGDEKAWKPLATRGLYSLTETALKDRSVNEVAEELATKPNTIAVQKYRVVQRLRQILQSVDAERWEDDFKQKQ